MRPLRILKSFSLPNKAQGGVRQDSQGRFVVIWALNFIPIAQTRRGAKRRQTLFHDPVPYSWNLCIHFLTPFPASVAHSQVYDISLIMVRILALREFRVAYIYLRYKWKPGVWRHFEPCALHGPVPLPPHGEPPRIFTDLHISFSHLLRMLVSFWVPFSNMSEYLFHHFFELEFW